MLLNLCYSKNKFKTYALLLSSIVSSIYLFIYLFIHSSIHSLRLTYANFYEPINVSNNTENETKS